MRFRNTESVNATNFLRLKDGESFTGVLRGDPHEFYTHWEGNRTVICPGKEKCEKCAGGSKPTFRFRLNFIVKENGAYTAKIFEQGWRVYKALAGLQRAGYDLEHVLVAISRAGSSKSDTVYNVVPVPKGEIDADKEKMLAPVKLHDLVNPQGDDTAEVSEESDEVPF